MNMENNLKAAESLMDTLNSVLGDNAPVKVRFLVDFKDPLGVDRNADNVAYRPRQMTDAQFVDAVKTDCERRGCKLSAITMVHDDGTGDVLYMATGFLEELLKERGIPLPVDMEATARSMGLHPVNWNELVKGWRKKRRRPV